MRIGVYGKTSNELVAAFKAGCEALGYSPALLNPAGYYGEIEPFDMVFIHGLHGKEGEVFNSYRKAGVPAIVADCGYIGRPLFYQLGFNGLCWLPPVQCADDRKLESITTIPATRKSGGEYVLVCSQVEGDKQHNIGMPIKMWADAVCNHIAAVTDKPIVLRPHPNWQIKPNDKVSTVSDATAETMQDALKNAWCMVTYNSTAANLALLMGVPVFCDIHSMYAPVANTDLDNINSPKFFDMEDYFNRLAYAQWSLDEIASGKALDFIMSVKDCEPEPISGEPQKIADSQVTMLQENPQAVQPKRKYIKKGKA